MPGRMDSAVPQSYTFFQSLYFIYRSIFEIYTIYLPTYLSIYLSIYIYNIYLSLGRPRPMSRYYRGTSHGPMLTNTQEIFTYRIVAFVLS